MPGSPASIEIRDVSPEEYLETGRIVADYAFGASPKERDREREQQNLQYLSHARTLVATIDERPQASLVSFPMTQNVRGKVMPMGGIGAVASMPAGRRQGVVRQMFERILERYRDDSVPVSTLYPFRDSFYERLGYASFPKPRFLTVRPETLAPLVRLDKPGACEQRSLKDGFNAWRTYLEQYQEHTHGFALRHMDSARSAQEANEYWVAFARHEGEIVGAMEFKITGYGERMIVNTFYTSNSVGKYQLLDWIGRHTDQVKEAIIELRPDDYPELWFRDLEATLTCGIDHAWPGPMGRVVDVAGLTGIGAGSGEITLDVRDATCPWNNDRFTLRAEGGRLSVSQSTSTAQGCITIQGLSALVFTGHDAADFAFRAWGDLDTAAQSALRAIFPHVSPDIHEKF